jgi:hypothetical protein
MHNYQPGVSSKTMTTLQTSKKEEYRNVMVISPEAQIVLCLSTRHCQDGGAAQMREEGGLHRYGSG